MRFLQLYTKYLEDQEIRPGQDSIAISGSDGNTPMLDSGMETKAMEVLRIGKNLDKQFWGNFSRLCNNTDGLAELLDVDVQKVGSWSAKITELLRKVDDKDAKKKNKIIDTGNSGPLANHDDAGPTTTPGDTAPTP